MSKRLQLVLSAADLERVERLRSASPLGVRPSISATIAELVRRGLDATNKQPPPNAA